MKGVCGYRSSSLIIFLSLFVFLSTVLNGYAARNPGHKGPDARDKKEKLIARGIGAGLSGVRWCGNDRLLVYGPAMGIDLLDPATGKLTTVSRDGAGNYPLDCSPDGKWVVYADRKSARMDKGRVEPGEEPDGEARWQGRVVDLYRYEVSTGKTEKFATRRDRPESVDVISPDGKKAFLGGTHNTAFYMWKPKLEVFWLDDEWVDVSPVWLADSSGIAALVLDDSGNPGLGVEVFGDKGWSGVFTPGLNLEINGRISDIVPLNDKTVSVRSVESYSEVNAGKEISRNRHYFYTCEIKRDRPNCNEVLEFDLGSAEIRDAVSPGGDIIFEETDYKCIRRFSQGNDGTECVADGPDLGRLYALSPDGSRIVYERYEKTENKGTSYDLYMMEINR